MATQKRTRGNKVKGSTGAPDAANSPPPQEAPAVVPPKTESEHEYEFRRGFERLKEADELADELAQAANLPARVNGKWPAGVSGNPAGRAKGSKNYITEQREAMESALREYISHPERKSKLMKLIDRTLEIGLTGADKDALNAAKIMFDRVLSGAKQGEEDGSKAPPKVVVVIENMTAKPAKAAVVVEGQFTEVHAVNERGQMTDNENAGSVGTVQLSQTGTVLTANQLSDTESELGNKAQSGQQTGTDTP